MPSFDIVSKVNSMEVENAVNQAQKELATRFDFKGSNAEIVQEKFDIKLRAPDAFKMRALVEIMVGKLSKRGIDLRSVDQGEADLSPLGHARQTIKIKQGIDGAKAKEISGFVRGLGMKVTAAIQGDELRVTGKNRDDLQAVMAAVRGHDFEVAVGFVNFRD
ncbi:MAG: YajQ family cyclic di-GMP-binding protein [Verrucomicrobia bacterium]|nr:MAG: YajQ family cyclic di-GMP-binding protein [Verrucomicrobiota bacterium]